MTPLTITCGSCGGRWTFPNTFSLYEQQAVESCPCPDCGCYTLCYHEPETSGSALAGEHPPGSGKSRQSAA